MNNQLRAKLWLIFITVVTYFVGILTLLIGFNLFGFWVFGLILLGKWFYAPIFIVAIADLIINKNPIMLIIAIVTFPIVKSYIDYRTLKEIYKQKSKEMTPENFEKWQKEHSLDKV